MIEFIYGLGAFLFDMTIWLLGMTMTLGLSVSIVLLVLALWKIITEEMNDGN